MGIYFSLCSFFFISILAVVYFSKKRIKTDENNLYTLLIITSLCGTIIGTPCYFAMKYMDKYPLFNSIFSRLYLIYLITWLMVFTLYIMKISISKFNKQKIYKSFFIIYIILSLLSCILPLYYESKNNLIFSYGPAVNFVYIVSGILILTIFYCVFVNIKSILNKKYIPLLSFMIFGIAAMIIQKINPSLLLLTFAESLITFIMYFTIENPDIKMIEELNKNRHLYIQANQDKLNLLFLMSEKLKKSINDVSVVVKDTLNIDDNQQKEEKLKEIDNLVSDLSFNINNVLDISTIDNSAIKEIKQKYNIYYLVEKIKLQKKKEINEKINFRVNIDNVPETLYGDPKLLELVIVSILNNAIKYTEEGFIELNITSIVKYDMARLIINFADSGTGISIDKVNYLLTIDNPLEKNDLKRLETMNVDINTIKKIIKKLGGYFMIKSEINKGVEIEIVLDQKIYVDKKEVDEYQFIKNFSSKGKILIASANMKFNNELGKILIGKGFDIDKSIYANDIFDRIRAKENFSYILLDDNLDKRALEILLELKKDSKFKIPVIIMLDKDITFIKEHFIKDGFSDYLVKDDLINEINRIFK